MNNDILKKKDGQSAWVVFTGQSELLRVRLLRRGFRHCFVVVKDGEKWLSLDPLAHRTELQILPVLPDFDVPAWLSGQGHTVLPAQIRSNKKAAPFALFTCVEAVKRVLGLRKRLVFTPYQLFRHLKKVQKGI